ncbi:SDR family NAD(P)-dependent oxidoreductase [Marinifilum sp. RC60d5]|uniref:SDR family NAD(P)-dependent oxidoreductase n=1 Tax=Marinifilum sp. RC60d5 TaxID=3458414 RepID=UPI004036ED90
MRIKTEVVMNGLKISPKGRVAFVSGANNEIGRALVIALLEEGASKVYAGVQDVKALKELKLEYRNRLFPLLLDMKNDRSIVKVSHMLKDIEILINNAEVCESGGLFSDNSLDSLTINFNLNVRSLLKITTSLLGYLKNKDCAAIVNIVSILGLASMPVAGTYSASKAAAHSITLGIRGELLNTNVLVMGVYPALVHINLAKKLNLNKALPQNIARNIILGLKNGNEYVFPDIMSKQIAELYLTEPVTVEKQFAHFVSEKEVV